MTQPFTVESLRAAIKELGRQSGQPISIEPIRLIVSQQVYDFAKAAKSPPKTGDVLRDAHWDYLWHSIHDKAAK